MRKVWFFTGLVVLAVLTSATAFAGDLGLVWTGDEQIDVSVYIAKRAIVTVGGDQSIDFEITELDGLSSSETIPVTIETNTPILVNFDENISRALLEQMRTHGSVPGYRVWRWDIHTWSLTQGALDNDNWLISPNVVVQPWSWNAAYQLGHGDGMRKVVPVDDVGRYTYNVGLEAWWRSRDSQGNPLPWWLLDAAATPTGTITITVEDFSVSEE